MNATQVHRLCARGRLLASGPGGEFSDIIAIFDEIEQLVPVLRIENCQIYGTSGGITLPTARTARAWLRWLPFQRLFFETVRAV